MTPLVLGAALILVAVAAVVGAIRNNRRWDRDETAVRAAVGQLSRIRPGGMSALDVAKSAQVRIDRTAHILRQMVARDELDEVAGPKYRLPKTGAAT